MEVERYLLASALTGIVSQKLARKLCDKCKKQRALTPYEQEMFKKFLDIDVTTVYEAVGCPHCSGGYHGRIAVQEVLLLSPQIKDAINAKIPKAKLRELVYSDDVITLLQDGLYKVIAGLTTISEVIKLTEADDEVNSIERIQAEHRKKENDENTPEEIPKEDF